MHGPKAPEEAGLGKEGAGQQRASLLVSQSQMWPSGTWLKCLPGAESLLAQGALKDCAVLPAVGDSGRSKSSGPSRSKNPVEFWTKLSFILDRAHATNCTKDTGSIFFLVSFPHGQFLLFLLFHEPLGSVRGWSTFSPPRRAHGSPFLSPQGSHWYHEMEDHSRESWI